jgi:hypothetical protein
LTNLQTFVESTVASSAATGLATGPWALVWVQLIVVALRAEQRAHRAEEAEADAATLTPA